MAHTLASVAANHSRRAPKAARRYGLASALGGRANVETLPPAVVEHRLELDALRGVLEKAEWGADGPVIFRACSFDIETGVFHRLQEEFWLSPA
ncbi:MAG: hypothetical protein ACKV19_18495 [Verrucomicrobiales bacterium]